MSDTSAVSPAPSSASSRILYLDLLRILASFGVIVLHTYPLPPEVFVYTKPQWMVFTALNYLFRWCVPVFYMISGALFLSPKKTLTTAHLFRKSIAHLATVFFSWSAFYALVHCILMDKGKWTFLNQLLRGHYHMWFLFAIFGLYVLTPLLRLLTASRKHTEFFLLLGLIWTFVIPRTINFALLFQYPHVDVVDSLRALMAQCNPLANTHSIFYFVLGHYLHEYPLTRRPRRALLAAGVLCYVLTWCISVGYSHYKGFNSEPSCGTTSLTVLFMSAAVFAGFRGLSGISSVRIRRVLAHLSSCSLGVYMLHPFFIERMQIQPPAPLPYVLIGMPAVLLLTYALSVAAVSLLRLIPPFRRNCL